MTDTLPPQAPSPDGGSAAASSDGGTAAAPRPAGPRLPLIPGPIETAVGLWRRLRRMSTALMLLFGLAIATIIATFIPQQPVIASTVAQWRDGSAGPGEAVARVFDALSLFDVFGSWWFAALTVLLFVSLTGCLVPRWRVFARNVRRPAARGSNLSRLSHHVVFERPSGDDDAVLDRVQGVFRFYRTRRVTARAGHPQLAVERGHWRELGSLVFHTSFYLLLIGVTLGAAYSFTGQIDIVEGGTFADTPLGYQSQTAGRLWSTDDHAAHLTTVDDFEVTYLDGDNSFVPDEFVSTVTFQPGGGGDAETREIRVNHPTHYNGLTYYQRAFGFAPEITLRSGLDGGELYASNLVLRTDANGLWTGRDKISQGSADPDRPLPQIGIEVFFLPDAEFGPDGGIVFNSPEANDPRLLVTIYSGEDLGLDQPVPVSQLDWPQSAVVDQAMITPGRSVPFAGGLFEVEFGDLAMWTGLQVSHQPFRWLLLTAASMTLMGLVPSLYAYRRRLWVEVHDDHVVLAGVAQHRKSQFEEEFVSLTDRVADAVGSRPPAARRRLRHILSHHLAHHLAHHTPADAREPRVTTTADLSNTLFTVTFGLYLVAMIACFYNLAFTRVQADGVEVSTAAGTRVGLLGTVMVGAGFATHLSSVIARALAAGRVPWGNMYEYGSAIALVVIGTSLVLVQRRYPHLMGFIIAGALLMMTTSLLLFTDAGPLVPALESYWLQIHVSAMMFSSSVFIVAFVATTLYLVKDRAERKVAATSTFGGSTVGAAQVATAPDSDIVGRVVGDDLEEAAFASPTAQRDALNPLLFPVVPFLVVLTFVLLVWRAPLAAMIAASAFALIGSGIWYSIPHLPPAARLDNLAYRTTAFAFPLITFGIMCGAIWAEEAWGRYWGWDPKETGSFVTWTLYAAYLHSRSTHGWRGRKAAWVGVTAFGALMVTYYAVNLFVVGLHSYAGV